MLLTKPYKPARGVAMSLVTLDDLEKLADEEMKHTTSGCLCEVPVPYDVLKEIIKKLRKGSPTDEIHRKV